MASKHTPSPAPPPQPPNASSKLPKFLQRNGRDRTGSVTERTPIASSSSSSEIPATPSRARRASRFLPRRDRDEDAAVVVEPIAIPRPAAESSSTRSIGDIPSRLSGWFTHTFNSSTTDLNLTSIMAQPSPKSKASALLTVAKHGKGHLDKAMRYLLDSDATPDRCTDPIWLLGVQHPGYEPSSPTPPPYATSRGKRVTSPPSSYRSSTSSIASSTDLSTANLPPSASQQHQQPKIHPGAHWPPVFYIDFISRIWLTYRSHFSQPIKDSTLTALCSSCPPSGGYDAVPISNTSTPASSPSKSRWHWGGEKTWSNDTGWGCMLRTGQSLLANALIHAHLGRGACSLFWCLLSS
jgi:cysteine protease ATG4